MPKEVPNFKGINTNDDDVEFRINCKMWDFSVSILNESCPGNDWQNMYFNSCMPWNSSNINPNKYGFFNTVFNVQKLPVMNQQLELTFKIVMGAMTALNIGFMIWLEWAKKENKKAQETGEESQNPFAVRPTIIYIFYATTQVALQVILAAQLYLILDDYKDKIKDFGGLQDDGQLSFFSSPIVISITLLVGLFYIMALNSRTYIRLYE